MEQKKPVKVSLTTAIILIMIFSLIIVSIMVLIVKRNIGIQSDGGQTGNQQSIVKQENIKKNNKYGTIDDWQFDGKKESQYDSRGSWGYSSKGMIQSATVDSSAMELSASSSAESNGTIGFSTGGAKDVENFRENINNGYFPISTDITYNGLFYDYTFDTGRKEETKSEDLFSPSYSTAVSKDPISENNEIYMTVGLNSNIKQSDFKRKKLNLVVVLDISGSMGSSFNSYYYDQFTGKENKKNEEDNKSKMQIANESVNILLDQLNGDDRFGMVLFESTAYLGKPISLISDTNVDAIKNHILEIGAMGGTNFEAGYTKATELFKEYLNINSDEYENRIIVITDAMPNYGETSDTGLMKYVKENASKGIYTSFVGVGVDFNTKLTEAISDVKGANYYSVHSSSEFKSRMGEEFEYMVTPLVFDLELNLKSDDFEIEKVYGSDTVNKENGNIMKVNTLFPSKTTSNGEVKGGVVLLKLKKKTSKTSGKATLSVEYKDRKGKEHSNSQDVEVNAEEEHYDNTGIRKAIVLTRYANVVKNWILYERTGEQRFIIVYSKGIIDCDYTPEEVRVMLGENERTSVKLSVSEKYKEIFKTIKQYISDENKEIKDDTLNQEIDVLNKLINL